MKHGDKVILKRGKKRYSCTVVSDHTALFPAITINRGGDEWIVGVNEIVSPEEIRAEEEAKKAAEAATVADVVNAFNAGCHTIRTIADSLGKQMIDVLSRCRKAERLGLIKMEKQNEPKPTEITPGKSEQAAPMSGV